MHNIKYWLFAILCIGSISIAEAHKGPEKDDEGGIVSNQSNTAVSYRSDCDQAQAQVDQDINNVRARLLSGGDVWWDSDDGKYVVPKVIPGSGIPEVSSIFAGAVWLGGLDPAGNLKIACQQYGSSSGQADFWPGPLLEDDPTTEDVNEAGTTNQDLCAQWDRFFVVDGENIRAHLAAFEAAQAAGEDYDPDLIPEDVKGWPAQGNEFFFDIAGFDLPDTQAGLGAFFDRDGDGDYNPDLGDYPVIQIRGCDEKPQFPDQMIFWIYNDAGNIHEESNGDAIQMEVQVQAFAYATNDEINDMTFQRYKLINRAIEFIDSTYFAMWVDPDLGCYTDDFIGCDTSRSLAYVYNEDAADGTTGCNCDQGVNTYCEDIPILGIDYFRGPLAPKLFDENGNPTINPPPNVNPDTIVELGMSSFIYINNASVGNHPAGTTDPSVDTEYYNYLSGTWNDGTPLTLGGNGYTPGSTNFTKFALADEPNDGAGWSMCTANLGEGDRRTVQASGPFRLDPGAVNELIVGAVWVPDLDYPCPDITKLLNADDIAQALFDGCFEITDGPDAPDVCFVELDEEIIAVFSNDIATSNNGDENYAEQDLRAPAGVSDSLYRFEGYKLFQMSGPDVSIGELDDPEKARLIYQVDLKNGISNIYNWTSDANPNAGPEFPNQPAVIWTPELEVEGDDTGLGHTFRITSDQFASGESNKLVNHKKYYFTAIAYAYNNYETFNPETGIGQRRPYLEGRRNIGDGENPFYTVIPRPIIDKNLNAGYGDGAVITRLDGIGVGGNFLDMSDETKEAIFDGSFDGSILYKAGRGPIDVKVYDPLNVRNGEFELTFVDEDMSNDELDDEVGWVLTDLTTNETIASESTIDRLNEQLITDYGFSISIGQTDDVGSDPNGDNGAIGYEQEYADPTGADWFAAIPDAAGPPYNYIQTAPDNFDDIKGSLSTMGAGFFVPYGLSNWRLPASGNFFPPGAYITPAWTNQAEQNELVNPDLGNLNNVDIVLTSDKSKWSRCIVVETANTFYTDYTFFPTHPTMLTEDNAKHFDVRRGQSVTKDDNDGDGRPDPDVESEGDGLGWFPGYAVDVETGERLNIFFGENSTYDGTDQADIAPAENYDNGRPNGRDMAWNPTSQTFLEVDGGFSIFNFLSGGQHFIYVTNEAYDECAELRERLDPVFSDNTSPLRKLSALKKVTWAGLPILQQGQELLSYKDGLIPNDITIKLRVDNPYEVAEGTNDFQGYPSYRFKIEGLESTELQGEQVDAALDMINVVPNPYYGYSAYETSQFTNTVKITNLPAKCDVKIFSLDGRFIRSYKRDEVGAIKTGTNPPIQQGQVAPAIEWDLKNSKGIPVASGVYLIHVDAGELGERVIKWFGVARQFDPSGL